LNANHGMVFGELNKSKSDCILAVEKEMAGCNFDSRLSTEIEQEMWEKWVFICTGAGITCLMRGSVGDIEAAGGAPLASTLLLECAEISASAGFPPSEASIAHGRATFTAPGSTLTASMFRDLSRGGRTECEHLLGDLLRRGKKENSTTSILRMAYTNVAAYEVARARLEAAKQ
jgi:2-dehydropantoate 2-reductase